MKKIYFFCLIVTILFAGCKKEIDYSKSGESIMPITDLNYTINGLEIDFNWQLPSEFPGDIIQPVSVLLKVYKDNKNISSLTIANSPTGYLFKSYNPTSEYRFIFKVKADVDNNDPNVSKLRYSSGVVAEIK